MENKNKAKEKNKKYFTMAVLSSFILLTACGENASSAETMKRAAQGTQTEAVQETETKAAPPAEETKASQAETAIALETNEAFVPEENSHSVLYQLKTGQETGDTETDAVPVPALTLDTKEKTFQFSYDVLSSYLAAGTYEEADDRLTLRTSDGKYTYVFLRAEDGALEFDESASSDVPLIDKNIGVPITDGSRFCPTDGD